MMVIIITTVVHITTTTAWHTSLKSDFSMYTTLERGTEWFPLDSSAGKFGTVTSPGWSAGKFCITTLSGSSTAMALKIHQPTISRLTTRHCQLLSHLHRLKIHQSTISRLTTRHCQLLSHLHRLKIHQPTISRLTTRHCQLLSHLHRLKIYQSTISRLTTRHCQLLSHLHRLKIHQSTISRLTTGHCQLLSHPHRLKISHSDECSCDTGPQTPNHILQSCPTFDHLRCQTWPSPVDAHRKLWGPVETLRQTADFALLTRLKT